MEGTSNAHVFDVVSRLRQVVGTYLQASLENLNRQSHKELAPIGLAGDIR